MVDWGAGWVHSNQRHVTDYCPWPPFINFAYQLQHTHTHIYTHTLIDIIKKYNPDVKGFSVAYGGPTSNNAKNNVAISGATAEWAISVMLQWNPLFKDTPEMRAPPLIGTLCMVPAT